MGSLKEFLAEQAEELKKRPSQAERKREEWVSSVKRLLATICGWLRESDPSGILDIQETTVTLREHGIGSYEAPGLSILLGPREVRVVPIARNVAGATFGPGTIRLEQRIYGRVDLMNTVERISLYRVENHPADRWILTSEEGYHLRPLDQANFESAITSLLT